MPVAQQRDLTVQYVADYLRMVTGSTPTETRGHTAETYLSLATDHGFNAAQLQSLA